MLGIAPRALYTLGKCSTTKLIPTLDLFLKKALRTILNINFSGNFMGFAGRRSGFKTSSTSNTLSLLPPHPPPPLSPDSHASQGRVKSSELRRYCGSKQPRPFPWAEKGVPFFHLPRGERQSARQVQRRPSPSISQRRPPREAAQGTTFLPVGNCGKHLARVQPQRVQLVCSLCLISHWRLGQPLRGSCWKEYRTCLPRAGGGKEPEERGLPPSPTVGPWGSP